MYIPANSTPLAISTKFGRDKGESRMNDDDFEEPPNPHTYPLKQNLGTN